MIIHAFFYESGCGRVVLTVRHGLKMRRWYDWFAIQSPKIFRAFREAGVDDFEEVSNVVADCDLSLCDCSP